jgi:rfaE bifunctional protein nucleotidyltransferase chain/domain
MSVGLDIHGRVLATLEDARVAGDALGDDFVNALAEAVATVAACFAFGGKVLVCGNGGSAADAQHLAGELVGRFRRERRALPAIALTTDSSVLTALANDFGAGEIFARQVAALAVPGDVLIAISTSGRSENVLRAVETATSLGVTTLALVGAETSPLAASAEQVLVVSGSSTPRVQEQQLVVEHTLCECVDEIFDGDRSWLEPPPGARKVLAWSPLLARRDAWSKEGRTVVWTNGCFDLLHGGHLASLRAARAFGDILVVGVNGDESVRSLKGAGRPIVCAAQRIELVGGLDVVDAVVLFEEDTPVRSLEQLRPDVHCKGADWQGRAIPERETVEAYGGRVAFTPLVEGLSTTDLARRIKGNAQVAG